MGKKQMSFRLHEKMIKALKLLALQHNVSLTFYVETVFDKHLKEKLKYGNITSDMLER